MNPRLLSLALPLLAACAPAEEPPRVQLPLVVETSGVVPVSTDLGYEVELTEARLVAEDFRFTTAGEAHARALRFTWISTAHAHPGHFQAGTVTGELLGARAFDLVTSGAEIGIATLLPATYASAAFTFGRGSGDAGIAENDPLYGHTAIVRAQASRDGRVVDADFVLDSPEGRVLTGVPFDLEVTAGTRGSLGLRLETFDALGGSTLFDGLDFFAVDPDEDGLAEIGPASEAEAEVAAYQTLLRRLQTHDYYSIQPLPEIP